MKRPIRGETVLVSAVLVASLGLASCISETRHRGYIMSEMALEQVPVGSSREQALVALGTPTTTADFGGESLYYISQTMRQPIAFMKAGVVDQRVLAVYLDADGRVSRIANYGLKDGRVFDFVSRTTPTTGSDVSFVGQLLSNTGRLGF